MTQQRRSVLGFDLQRFFPLILATQYRADARSKSDSWADWRSMPLWPLFCIIPMQRSEPKTPHMTAGGPQQARSRTSPLADMRATTRGDPRKRDTLEETQLTQAGNKRVKLEREFRATQKKLQAMDYFVTALIFDDGDIEDS
jgi:hypothetical protein